MTIHVEHSTDLVHWTEVAVVTVPDDDDEHLVWTMPKSDRRGFVRVWQ